MFEALFGNKDKDPNPIDENRQGLIGKPVSRVDGPLKVTGGATYAYEYTLPGQTIAYGTLLGASIAKGKIISINTSKAQSIPGVLTVMTYKNSPMQAAYGPPHNDQALERAKPYLDSADIRYYGEPVAFVVAESFEVACYAASLIDVKYQLDGTPKTSVATFKSEAYKPKVLNAGTPTDSSLGDFDKAFKEAPVKVDSTYTTPYQSHNSMEPHATLAVWNGDKLKLYIAHQLPTSAQNSVAKTLKISKDDVQIICPYVGGGFGGKLPTEADAILSALAARELKRPVKTALTRQQVFSCVYHRTESIQRVRLGATQDGKLTSIGHESWLQTATFDEFGEQAGAQTRSLYAAPNRMVQHRLVKLDLPPSGSMRAPGEAIGLLALEQAMDEMAEKLALDPIEFRLRNEPTEDPEKKIPYSTRALPQCLKEGAKRFGWERRSAKPGQMRDGQWLVGYGVASAFRSNLMRPSKAEVSIDGQGKLTARLAMTDIGTGSYTILTQIAAETMQMPMSDVTVLIGDTSFPPTPGSGGSFGANSAGSGLYYACMNLRQKLAETATADKYSPLLKLKAKDADFKDGAVIITGKSESYRDIAARADGKLITAKGEIGELETYKTYSQAAYGGHFAEVGVDLATGEVRLRRMLGVFTAGRILNEKTARSQGIGGMLWGVSSALFEDAVPDTRYGQFVNHDLAEYHVPVHADAVNVEAIFLPEVDDKTGPLKIKGVGELGICGAGAAVANAVYNACGVRVRDYPITLDKVLKGLA